MLDQGSNTTLLLANAPLSKSEKALGPSANDMLLTHDKSPNTPSRSKATVARKSAVL